MELEGNLKAFPLSDILRFLAMGRMTGILTFINNQLTVELAIKEGMLIGTGSTEHYMRLGQVLVYSGLLSRKNLDEVLESQRDSSTGRMLGEILIERGYVTTPQVEQALTLQIKEELWELFSWNDGTFKFEHGERRSMQRLLVSLDIEPLIEEGFSHMEQWRAIASNLGDLNEIFRVRPDLAAPPEAKLSLNCWLVLSLINGRHSLQVLIYLSGLGKFETLRSVDQLLNLHLIEPVTLATKRSARGTGDIIITSLQSRHSANPAVQPETSDPASEGQYIGLRGLLGIKRKNSHALAPEGNAGRGQETPVASRVGPFLTSVGLACALINRLGERLCLEADIRSDGGATLLSETIWNEVGMHYPRADLIGVCEGRFDASRYEKYVTMAGGVDKHLAGCQEDCMEAMAAVGQRLVGWATEKLGERAAKVLGDTAHPFLEQVEVSYPLDFMPRLWASSWMGR